MGVHYKLVCKSRSAWDERGARKFSIPARSPDPNPMENIFHTLIKKLHLVALEMKIECEDFEEYSARIKENTGKCTVDVMDRPIRSMDKQIDLIVKRKVRRIRY